jgi:hypothetical protein
VKKIMAGHYEYRGYAIIKDSKVGTRRSGALVEWKVFEGNELTGTFKGKHSDMQSAKEWIDNEG